MPTALEWICLKPWLPAHVQWKDVIPLALGKEHRSTAKFHGSHFPEETPGYFTKVRNLKKKSPNKMMAGKTGSIFETRDKLCNRHPLTKGRTGKYMKRLNSHDFSHSASMSGQLLGMCFRKHKLTLQIDPGDGGQSAALPDTGSSPPASLRTLMSLHFTRHSCLPFQINLFIFWLPQVLLAPQCSTKVLDLSLLPPVGHARHVYF